MERQAKSEPLNNVNSPKDYDSSVTWYLVFTYSKLDIFTPLGHMQKMYGYCYSIQGMTRLANHKQAIPQRE